MDDQSTQQLSAEAAYPLWASSYADFRSPLHVLEEAVLADWFGEITYGTALDVACGTGRISNWLKSHCGSSVFGIDRCEEMLRAGCDGVVTIVSRNSC